MEKDTFYFSHDYNARTDEKIQLLIFKHKMEGYGLYWAIVEDLYNNANAMRTHYERIAFNLHAQCDMVKSVIEDFDLFKIEGGMFSSTGVEKRLNDRINKSIKARESAISGWEKRSHSKRNANAKRTQSDRNAIKERKGNSNSNTSSVENSSNSITVPSVNVPLGTVVPTHTKTQLDGFKKFETWLGENAPKLLKMKKPFTIKEYLKLKELESHEQIVDMCLRMENRATLLKDYDSAYLTYNNWRKNRNDYPKGDSPSVGKTNSTTVDPRTENAAKTFLNNVRNGSNKTEQQETPEVNAT